MLSSNSGTGLQHRSRHAPLSLRAHSLALARETAQGSGRGWGPLAGQESPPERLLPIRPLDLWTGVSSTRWPGGRGWARALTGHRALGASQAPCQLCRPLGHCSKPVAARFRGKYNVEGTGWSPHNDPVIEQQLGEEGKDLSRVQYRGRWKPVFTVPGASCMCSHKCPAGNGFSWGQGTEQ